MDNYLRSVLLADTPDEAIDLINKLIEFEPEKRITAKEALDHPFFAGMSQPVERPVLGKRKRADIFSAPTTTTASEDVSSEAKRMKESNNTESLTDIPTASNTA